MSTMIARSPCAPQATSLTDRRCRRELRLGGACSARATLIEAQNLCRRLFQAGAGRSFAHAALQDRPQGNAQHEHHRSESEPKQVAGRRAQGAARVGQNGNPEQCRCARQQDAAPDAAGRALGHRRAVVEDSLPRVWWKSSVMRRASHTRISVQRNGGTCLAAANADHEEPISNSLRKNLPGNWFRASSPRPAFGRVDWATCQIDAMHQSPSLQQQA